MNEEALALLEKAFQRRDDGELWRAADSSKTVTEAWTTCREPRHEDAVAHEELDEKAWNGCSRKWKAGRSAYAPA